MSDKPCCPTCGSTSLTWNKSEGQWTTLLGWRSEPGHNHNPNCVTRMYECENRHRVKLSVKNRCCLPGCTWVQRDECFCHPGKKIDYRPGEAP